MRCETQRFDRHSAVLVVRLQVGQHGRFGAGAQYQVQTIRRVGQQAIQQFVYGWLAHQVQVVQDQNEPLPWRQVGMFVQLIKIAQQAGDDILHGRELRRLDESQRVGARVRKDGADSGHEIVQEARQVAVAFVQRKPCAWSGNSLEPLDQQRCLAKAGRR